MLCILAISLATIGIAISYWGKGDGGTPAT